MMCFKCNQWGKHRANECKYSNDQLQALKPQDPNSPPSGKPYDPHYNLPQTASVSTLSTQDSKN